MQLYHLSLSVMFATLVQSSPTPQSSAPQCAVCPANFTTTPDLAANITATPYYLVATSGDGAETPTFCGFNANPDPNPVFWQFFCFFNNQGNLESSTSELCPSTADLATCEVQ